MLISDAEGVASSAAPSSAARFDATRYARADFAERGACGGGGAAEGGRGAGGIDDDRTGGRGAERDVAPDPDVAENICCSRISVPTPI